MKAESIFGVVAVLLLSVALAVPSFAQQTKAKQKDKDKKVTKAQDTVDKIREADPPQAKPSKDTPADRAKEAQKQKDAEARATAKKYPAKGKEVPPPASGKEKKKSGSH